MNGPYRLILADPPWAYRNGGRGAARNHYPTMSTPAICALEVDGVPVAQLAHPDSVLILWATNTHVPDALEVLQAWGFEWKTMLPWIKTLDAPAVDLFGELDAKPFMGLGHWVRGCSEPIIIAARGDAKAPAPADRYLGLLAKPLRHSRKPENVYQLAETFPGPRLELFARYARPGWDCWGNEVEAGPGSALATNAAPALVAG